VCVPIASRIQHAQRTRRTVLSPAACLALRWFFLTLCHKRHDLKKKFKVTEHKMCVLIFLFGSEARVLKKREEQRLEAAEMKFLRHLLGITKLDREKNQCIRD